MGRKGKFGTRGNYDGVASDHPLYFRWLNMLRRCYDPNFHGYKSYGGIGVTVEPFLQNFTNYIEFVSSLEHYNDLLLHPSEWQIDKDGKGGNIYSRDTIQIVHATENIEIENAKRRMPVMQVLPNGETRYFCSISVAEKETGIWRGNIARAIKTGYRAGGFKWERAS